MNNNLIKNDEILSSISKRFHTVEPTKLES